jgi:hypothetical protein
MKHTVPHDLDLDTAKKVTDKALESYRERFAEYNPVVTWTEDCKAEVAFKAKGVTLKGLFCLTQDAIEMDMEVPFVLRLFQKKAVDVVEREILTWIDKAKKGEL